MSESRGHFEQFADHSRLKHAILNAYVLQWAMITLSRASRERTACFIDAFAGAGRDHNGNPGSGLIAVRASAIVRAATNGGRLPAGRRLRIALIEKKKRYFDSLVECTQHMISQASDDFLLLNGSWEDYVTTVRQFAAGAPCLTFLDPFGIEGLSACHYPDLLRGDRDELFALVSDIGAARLHGVIAADTSREQTAVHSAFQHLSLFPEDHTEKVQRLRQNLESLQGQLDVQQPAARRILLSALGSEERLAKVSAAAKELRPDEFLTQFVDALQEAGAKRTLLIPMRDAEGRYKYTLVHASKSPRALRAMKEAVSSSLKKDDLSIEMRSRIREDLALPIHRFADWIIGILNGRRFGWTASEREIGLKDLLLEETAIFPFQTSELRDVLSDRGHLSKTGRRMYFEF